MSACRSCNAEIIWAVTEAGRRIPLDAEPVKSDELRGLFVLYDGPERVARTVPPVYRTHFATCPNADQHRGSRS